MRETRGNNKHQTPNTKHPTPITNYHIRKNDTMLSEGCDSVCALINEKLQPGGKEVSNAQCPMPQAAGRLFLSIPG
ncbi:hypothetical protein H6G04_13975 [Calothrix membranacea FACHB-236]|nr:hypothetical protein [Calothrix membranacea FACHB-236]